MPHQKEVPPEVKAAGIDLGNRIGIAIAAWAKETGADDARAVMIALHVILSRIINEMPPQRRRGYVDDFIRALKESAGTPS